MICCFLGHKDAPESIYPKLVRTIKMLISEYNVSSFLVGNQGRFDGMALKALREIKKDSTTISYNVVLVYMPLEKQEYEPYQFGETVLPEGIEGIHPKYAISWRNKWMVRESDYVIAYITHSWGGAAQHVQYADKHNKTIFNIATSDAELA